MGLPTNMLKDVVIREANHNDLAFIYSAYLNSFQDSLFTKGVPKDVYFPMQTAILEKILKSPITRVVVATDKDMLELIYGFAIYAEASVLHYIYIKRAFRGFGLSEMLTSNFPFTLNKNVYATHMTYRGKKIIDKYGLIYNPYLMLGE